MRSSLTRKSAAAVLPAAGLLIAVVPAADAASPGTAAAKAPGSSPSTYAVTVTVRSGRATIIAHGLADATTHTADLITRLPSGRTAEARFADGRAYLHLTTPAAPWLSVAPATLGIPVPALWAAARTSHLTVKLGPDRATTVTITLTPAPGYPIQAPARAIDLTRAARGSGPLARHILGFLAGHN
jgi:hypothetical protein